MRQELQQIFQGTLSFISEFGPRLCLIILCSDQDRQMIAVYIYRLANRVRQSLPLFVCRSFDGIQLVKQLH